MLGADLTPGAVARLPDALQAAVADAYAAALGPVLGSLAPLFVVALVVVALLPDRPLRSTLAPAPSPTT